MPYFNASLQSDSKIISLNMAIERNNELLCFHSLKEETSLTFLGIIIMLTKYMYELKIQLIT